MSVTGTINGETYSVPDGCRCIREDEYQRLNAFANIVSDLDRSMHGRHQGDGESQDPTGISQGNPFLPYGATLGYTISGHEIIHPPRADRHDPGAWIRRI